MKPKLRIHRKAEHDWRVDALMCDGRNQLAAEPTHESAVTAALDIISEHTKEVPC